MYGSKQGSLIMIMHLNERWTAKIILTGIFSVCCHSCLEVKIINKEILGIILRMHVLYINYPTEHNITAAKLKITVTLY